MRLLLIRTGPTEDKAGNLSLQRDNARLDDQGRQQANRLMHICLDYHVDYVITSSDTSAGETGHILAHGIKKGIEVMEEFDRRNWGDWKGKKWENAVKVLDTMTMDQKYQYMPPNGESIEQLERRLNEGIKKIQQKGFESVALVTHESSLRSLACVLKHAPYENSFLYSFAPGSITIMEQYPDGRFHEVPLEQ